MNWPLGMRSVLLTFFILICLSTQAEEQVTRRFDESILTDPQYLSSYDESYIEVGDEGLHYQWMERPKEFPGSSVKTQFGLRGDFDVTFRFKVNQLGVPKKGWGSGILLRFDFKDFATTGVSLQRQVRVEGNQVVSVDHTRHGMKEHDVQAVPIEADAEIDGFRVTRRGETMEIAGLRDGKPLPAYWSLNVSKADVFPVGFHLHSGSAIADLDVVFEEFRISADKILKREEVAEPFSLLKYGIVGAIAFMIIAAALWRARISKSRKANSEVQATP